MFGENKERRFMVMDGSDKKFLKEIIGICEMVVGPRLKIMRKLLRKIRYRRLDDNHPTMMVFTINTHYRNWETIRNILEENYPEQIVFETRDVRFS